ncbi:MAG: hypothetical protein LC667_04245 [Thioalkalivibrio sp.]|nr:hypothetical protein [Thioalkalivibrio sp.]
MTGDLALLTPDAAPDPSIVLQPDPRGSPQLGERVSLYSGLGDGNAIQRVFEGTVERITPGGVWIRMDESFEPGLLSGSPVLSQHTAKVVGVTTAALVAPGPLRIGISPIRIAVDAGMVSY